MEQPTLKSRRVEVADSFEAIQDYYEEQGWTDGLPVTPATEDAVRRMLGAFGEDPGHSLGGNPAPQRSGDPGESCGQRRHGRVPA